MPFAYVDPEVNVAEATMLLDTFAEFSTYKHGPRNPHLAWLRSVDRLKPEQVSKFYNYWYPVSRRQPQILLKCAAAYPDQPDREQIMNNYLEEDGLVHPGDNPHYDLLEMLINKIGGSLNVDPEAQQILNEMYERIPMPLTAASASGVLAGLEHPALDISAYFHETIARSGFPELLDKDIYLTIHVTVEPHHIIWSHKTALRYIQQGQKDEVVSAFRQVMDFWVHFWEIGFSRLQAEDTASAASFLEAVQPSTPRNGAVA